MTKPETPLRGEWRCSNCGDVADHLDDGTLMDVRYALGYCSSCSLRGKVPLIRGTHADVMAIISSRKEKAQRDKWRIGLRSGAIADHPYTGPTPARKPCCALKRTDHLTQHQLDTVLEVFR